MNPTRRQRVYVAVAVCLLTGIISWLKQHQAPEAWLGGDYTFHWRAARALLNGQSPYDVIRPVGEYPFNDEYRYPLPAALTVLPLAWLRAKESAAVFLALCAGLLAFGITRTGFHRLLAFASVPFIFCLTGSQLPPLLMAASLLPALGGLLVTKPTIGLALFVAHPNRRAVLGGLALLLASALLVPTWPIQWLHAATAKSGAEGNYQIPILVLGGPLILLGLARWRRPEARLLVALALVPQSFFFYDQFPLALIPQSRREHMSFSALGVAALVTCKIVLPAQEVSLAATSRTVATVCIVFLFLPCLIMILRRPNEGRAPEWLERAIARWPAALRGSPASNCGMSD